LWLSVHCQQKEKKGRAITWPLLEDVEVVDAMEVEEAAEKKKTRGTDDAFETRQNVRKELAAVAKAGDLDKFLLLGNKVTAYPNKAKLMEGGRAW
jgi:hypothetical protein